MVRSPEFIQHTDDGGARTVAVIHVDLVASAQMIRREVHSLLDAGDDGRATRMQGPVKICGGGVGLLGVTGVQLRKRYDQVVECGEDGG